MCLICIEFDKRTMTTREARRALGEMVVKLDRAHVDEVKKKLDAADEEADAAAKSAP
jgi:hypothetical protein